MIIRNQMKILIFSLIFVLMFIPFSLALPSDTAAAYSFDAGSGTNLIDYSGNANTGTIVGPTWTAGKYGNALLFDGINDRIDIPNSASLDISGNGISISMWVNPQQLTSGDSVILAKFWSATKVSPYYQYGIELTGGNIPTFYFGSRIIIPF